VTLTFATSSLYTEQWNFFSEEFANRTGIEVEVTPYNQGDMLSRLTNQLRAQQADFDAWIADVMTTGTYMDPGFAEPLDDYLNDDSLLMDGYNYDDHISTYARFYGKWNGTTYGLPWQAGFHGLVVRTDILDQYADEFESEFGEDIMPPYPEGYESYDKFDRVAKFMNDRGHQISIEGKRGWNIVYSYPNRFADETGERTLVEGGESKLDMDGAEAALQHYVDEAQWAVNPTSTAFSESKEQFMSGETWAVEQWPPSMPDFIDEYGWQGDMRLTATPGGHPCLGGWGYMINSFSDQMKKEAAFLFGQFISSKEMDKKNFLEWGGLPTRESSYTDEVKSQAPQLDYYDPASNPAATQQSIRPRGPQYQSLGTTMQVEIGKALSGSQGVSETMDKIHSSWQDTLSG